MPAVRILTFDGSIERIKCIMQHVDFIAMTNPTVLEQVGPLLKDRNGRSLSKTWKDKPVMSKYDLFLYKVTVSK